jgi:predicted DNA-binding transcriptional regulator AlpA
MAIDKLLRYSDLKALGIVNNRVTLGRLIKTQGFPPGKLLGQNTRVWPEGGVQTWLNSRPVEREPDARERRFTAAAAKAKAGTVKTKRQRRARR